MHGPNVILSRIPRCLGRQPPLTMRMLSPHSKSQTTRLTFASVHRVNIGPEHLSDIRNNQNLRFYSTKTGEKPSVKPQRLATMRSLSTDQQMTLMSVRDLNFLRVNYRRALKLPGTLVSGPKTMLSSVYSRLMSTFSPPMERGSIKRDQDKLMSESRGNKKIKINCCGQLYVELAKSKPYLFGTAPINKGIDFNVHYYDSKDLLRHVTRNSKTPVVCLLHGAPGHFKDYASLINFLTLRGVRVVAPNFPDYSATFDHGFRHSPKERLDFLTQFFRAIQLDRIDMLIGHSSAVYTMFEMLQLALESNDSKLQIKSLGLFSTPSYELPKNLAVTPFRLFALKLFDYPLLRPFVLALIHTFAKLQGIQNRVEKDNIENLLIAASAMGYSEHERMRNQLHLVHKFAIPTFLLFGTNDRLIPMDCFEQLKKDLGVKDDNQIRMYDSNGNLRNNPAESDSIVVSQFESGGHYAFQRYSTQVNEDVYKFLIQKVIKHTFESTKL